MSRRFDLHALNLWPESPIPGAPDDVSPRSAGWAENRAWLRAMAPEALHDPCRESEAPSPPPPLTPLGMAGVAALCLAPIVAVPVLAIWALGWWGVAGMFAGCAAIVAWACWDVWTGKATP